MKKRLLAASCLVSILASFQAINPAAAAFGTRANFDISGGLAGGQVGYNWQAGSWVFGVEADGDWADIDGAVRCPNPAFSCTGKVRDLASFRGRVGWAT